MTRTEIQMRMTKATIAKRMKSPIIELASSSSQLVELRIVVSSPGRAEWSRARTLTWTKRSLPFGASRSGTPLPELKIGRALGKLRTRLTVCR